MIPKQEELSVPSTLTNTDSNGQVITIKINPNISNKEFSKFTKQNLLDLLNPTKSYLSPLSTIAHIDVNAFFAQVEQIRTNRPITDPIVCVQWTTLIAVSYAAREYGINRMDTLETAKLKCPNLIPIHTATFKKGEDFWRYRDGEKDMFPDPKHYKVSLDPYRRESRKLMRVFKKWCGNLVEKASVDECFLDLGPLVIKKLFHLIPKLETQLNELENGQMMLPCLPETLELNTYGHIIGHEEEVLMIDDYDELLLILGSIISHEIRQEIQETLGYTTSCGIHHTKTIAKLASGFRKPNNQTIVLPNQTRKFLKDNFQITDFWSMGGKTGEYLCLKLIPEEDDDLEEDQKKSSIEYIRTNYNLAELSILLDDQTLASKLYEMVHGIYRTVVQSKVQLKSMNSSKNMRPGSCQNIKDCHEWIRIFAVDLSQRLIEIEDELGKKTRPKTIGMSMRSRKDFGSPHSKRFPISNVFTSNEELRDVFYADGVKLVEELVNLYGVGVFPLANLSLTISNFEMLELNFEKTNIMNFVRKGGDSIDQFKGFAKEKEKMLKKFQEKEKEKDGVLNNKNRNLANIDNVFKAFQTNLETDIIKTEPEINSKNLPLMKDIRIKQTIDKAFQNFKSQKETIMPVNNNITINGSIKREEPIIDLFKGLQKVDKIKDQSEWKQKIEEVPITTDKFHEQQIKSEKYNASQIKDENSIFSLNQSKPTSTHRKSPEYKISETSQKLICLNCLKELNEDIEEHNDYHFALDLSKSFDTSEQDPRNCSKSNRSKTRTITSDKKKKITSNNKRIKLEKGQATLPF